MSRIEEYDDGYDSKASFEAAGADQPEHVEPEGWKPTIYEVDRVLVCSTAHITEAIADQMNGDAPRDEGMEQVTFDRIEYGYLLWVGEGEGSLDNLDAYPECLQGIVRLAWRLECNRVRIDCDGPMYEELPTWDW